MQIPSNEQRRAGGRLGSLLIAAVVAVAGATASTAALAGDVAFDARLSALLEHIRKDPDYKRLPTDSHDSRTWFYEKTEALYKKKMTKAQYIAEGLEQFPGYEASLAEVADFVSAD